MMIFVFQFIRSATRRESQCHTESKFLQRKSLYAMLKTFFLKRVPSGKTIGIKISFEITLCLIFRFYFKTEVDGDMCYEEETEDSHPVPLWEGKILVQCRLVD